VKFAKGSVLRRPASRRHLPAPSTMNGGEVGCWHVGSFGGLVPGPGERRKCLPTPQLSMVMGLSKAVGFHSTSSRVGFVAREFNTRFSVSVL